MTRLDLVYGESGSGKTTWALQLAQYFWLKHHKRTRWYLGDGGGETIRQLSASYEGEKFIEIWEYPLWKNPFETTHKMVQGGWPLDPLDPTSKVIVPSDMDRLEREYGLFVYEGLTVMSDYMMGDIEGGLAQRMAKGENLNKDDSFRIKDGELALGGNARTHYGLVQRRVPQLLRDNARLRGFKLWTAHEQKSEDDVTREIVIGPDVCGKALTAKIMASFGHTVHLTRAAKRKKIKDPLTGKEVEEIVAERRAYTESHYDPNGTHFAKYLANVRIPEGTPSGTIPLYYAPPDPLKFYADLASAQKQALAAKETLLANVELTF
jgi:hypothetical protein